MKAKRIPEKIIVFLEIVPAIFFLVEIMAVLQHGRFFCPSVTHRGTGFPSACSISSRRFRFSGEGVNPQRDIFFL